MENVRKREFGDRIVIGALTKKGINELTRISYRGEDFFKTELALGYGFNWDTVKDYEVKFLLSGEVYLIILNKK